MSPNKQVLLDVNVFCWATFKKKQKQSPPSLYFDELLLLKLHDSQILRSEGAWITNSIDLQSYSVWQLWWMPDRHSVYYAPPLTLLQVNSFRQLHSQQSSNSTCPSWAHTSNDWKWWKPVVLLDGPQGFQNSCLDPSWWSRWVTV